MPDAARPVRIWRSYSRMLTHPTEGAAVILWKSGIGAWLVRRFPALREAARAWFAARRPWRLRLLGPSIYHACFVGEVSDDRRYEFLRSCLEGSGVDWADHYDQASVEDRLRRTPDRCSADEAYPIYRFLRSLPNARTLFIQVGCSSGVESFWVAREKPHCTVVGTDVTEGIVHRARHRHALPNLDYVVADARALADVIRSVLDRESFDLCVLFSSGSAQYVLPTHLETLFSRIASIRIPWVVALFEPASVAAGHPFALDASRDRGEFSWTHNYVEMLTSAGFRVETKQVVHPYGPDHATHRDVVHVFVVGRRDDSSGGARVQSTT